MAEPHAKGFFGQYGSQAIGALVVAVVGAAVAAVSQLGGRVGERLFPETVVIGQEMSVVENRDTPLRVVLKSAEGGGLSGGTVTLSSADPALLLTGPTVLSYPKSPGAVVVPTEGEAPSFRARTAGVQKIKVDVETNQGRAFSGFVTVRSAASDASVTESDLSGVWRVRLNDRGGQMRIRQRSRSDLHLTGDIQMDDGARLTIPDGFRDGVVFQISAEDPSARRYDIQGVWCAITQSQSRWMVVNAKVQAYAGDRPVPAGRVPRRLEERCPQAEEMLSETGGDGVFHATAPLG